MCENVDWIKVVHIKEPRAGACGDGNKPLGAIKESGFLKYNRDHMLFKKEPAPWN
jgi:hypothetical protein